MPPNVSRFGCVREQVYPADIFSSACSGALAPVQKKRVSRRAYLRVFRPPAAQRGRKVVSMTIKVLLQQVDKAEGEKLPSAKSLRESGVDVVLTHPVGEDTEICVYQNGYVTYRAGCHVTVFPLHDVSGDYTFEFAGERKTVEEKSLDEVDAIVRLVMEGEDRISRNTDVIYGRKKISYSQEAEDWGVMADEVDRIAQTVDRMFAESLMGCLTYRQKVYVRRYFFKDQQMKEIGEALGVSKQAVSDSIRQALAKMKAEAERESGNGRKD